MGRHAQPGLRLTDAEISKAFTGKWAAEYPPILTSKQAARLAGVKIKTIYDWSHRKLLHKCAHKKGTRLRFIRNRFVRFLFGIEE